MNNNHIIILDYETGSLDSSTCQVTQLAACHLDPTTLELGDIFNSEVCPQDPDNEETLTTDSLVFCGKTKEALMDKPPLEEVWKNFCAYLKPYTGKSKYTRPIVAGYNVRGFDNVITARLCKQFGNVDKDGKQKLFSDFMVIDLMETIWLLTENHNDLKRFSGTGKANIKFETVCRWLGIPTHNLHDAETDVKKEGAVIAKFMKLYRTLWDRVPFEGSMKGLFDEKV